MTTWEEVTYTKLKERTERLAVPGGWLYRTQMLPYVDGPAPAVALVFVPGRAEPFSTYGDPH